MFLQMTKDRYFVRYRQDFRGAIINFLNEKVNLFQMIVI